MTNEHTSAPGFDHETFQTAFKFAPIGMAFLSLSGKWLRVNRSLCEILGLAEQDLLATTMEALIHPEDTEPVARYLKNIRDGMILGYQMEVRYLNPHGNPVWVLQSAALIRDADGDQSSLLVQIQDITLRKRSEQALRESEERFRVIFDNSNDGILLADSETKRFIFGNKTICQMLDRSPDEIKELGVMDIHPLEDLPRIIDQFEKQAKKEIGIAKDLPVKRKGGSIFYADVSSFPITLAGKTYLVGDFRDVTLRKQAEEALRQSEERFRVLFEQAADIILLLEIAPGGIPVIRDANSATFKLLGYERDELIGQPVSFLEAAPDASKVVGERRENILSGLGTIFEARHRCKDGTIRDFECSATEMQIGAKTLALSVERDITERKRVEKQARERMKELRAFYSLAELTEREGITLDKLYREFTGILPKSWQYPEIACARIVIEDSEFRTENFTESPWKQSAPVKVNGSVVGRVEVGYLEEKPEEDEGPFVKEERLFIDAIAERIGRISERKRAEEALEVSEEKYRALIETTNTGYVIIDSAGRVLDANREYVRLTGHETLEEIRGRRVTEWTAQHDLARNAEEVRKCMERGFVRNLEIDYVSREGKITPIEVNASVLQMSQEVRIVTLCRDVT